MSSPGSGVRPLQKEKGHSEQTNITIQSGLFMPNADYRPRRKQMGVLVKISLYSGREDVPEMPSEPYE